ncbi:MAG: hypothetical protein WCP82_11250 [Alphaproteobacteria bacterium]
MAMRDYLDLIGASGASYRFRFINVLEALPAMSGNFVFVRDNGDGLAVICCGTEDSLLNAASYWPAAVQAHQVEAIFVRLNISWKVRSFEHEDIVKLHQPVVSRVVV